ncbi:MAG: tRNA pseudouridine(38-40) synthase TruA [Ruminococcaceae bacterium]|nr:tRNA pseudouridine(38-40) synthase TruA [Oscillospiraceae bacterium]
MNYKLTLAYDGTRYRGWQRLPGDKQSIQGRIEAVLSRMEGTSVQIHGSGRTDAGVHALGQVASVQLSGDRSPREILDYVNRHLPNDIGLLSVEPAEPRFHARLTPSRKTYRYRIWASDAPCIFERRFCYCPERIPDADAMSAAAGAFPGTHDFAAFHTGRTNKSTVRTIDRAQVARVGPELHFTVTGDGFLYNMVRIMAGTLLEIGWGERPADDIPRLLSGAARAEAGFTAPPQGLCLMEVTYL